MLPKISPTIENLRKIVEFVHDRTLAWNTAIGGGYHREKWPGVHMGLAWLAAKMFFEALLELAEKGDVDTLEAVWEEITELCCLPDSPFREGGDFFLGMKLASQVALERALGREGRLSDVWVRAEVEERKAVIELLGLEVEEGGT